MKQDMSARFILLLLLTFCSLCGCATGSNPRDPWESLNRKVYSFNTTVDRAVLKPVAKGYVRVVPRLVRRGVANFFGNLGMPVITLNDLLQLKGSKVPVDIVRFATNTVFGLGGLIDVASELKIERRNEDFGQTLGYWGIKSGPYLVLPLFGPSNIRDSMGTAVDYVAHPTFYWDPSAEESRWIIFALDIIDTRAQLLDAEKFLDAAAIDRYSFLRDAYLQRREFAVRDGNLPASTDPGSRPKTLKELEEEDLMDEPVPLRTAPRVQ